MFRRGKKKDKFADLEEEFRAKVQGSSDAEIKTLTAEATLNHAELMAQKEKDQDLKEARERASEAGAIYREGTKRYKLKVGFCKLVLETRGKPAGDAENT